MPKGLDLASLKQREQCNLNSVARARADGRRSWLIRGTMKSAGELSGDGASVSNPGSGVVSSPPALAMPASTKSPVVGGGKSRIVRLRDHPLMTRKSGTVGWPPLWKCVGNDRGVVQGEVGMLEDVSMHDSIEDKIFIAMSHMSEKYIAVLVFDDGMFAKQIYSLFVQQIGRSIREIGDLDLSHLL